MTALAHTTIFEIHTIDFISGDESRIRSEANMTYAAIKHKPEQEKLYWFKVPDRLVKYVELESQVLCDTSVGKTLGTVKKIMSGFEDNDFLHFTDGKEIKNILSVMVDFNIEDIHIPWDMQKSPPNKSKIAKRVGELYEHGRFYTSVTFTPDKRLIDGYSAYLVAKMFGHGRLYGYCSIEDGGRI